MIDQIDWSETDLFKRIESIGMQKLHIYQKSPYVFDFMGSSVQEGSPEVKDIIKQMIDPMYEEGMAKIYQGIDYSKFREDVDIEKAIEILNWTMLGFEDKALQQINAYENIGEFGEQYLKEWEAYSDILKHSFYKQ